MLKYIHLENYRGFKKHTLALRPNTIIVGGNNAGKSTMIEAIRLVSLVTNRYKNLTYSRPPQEVPLSMTVSVVSPSLEDFNINFDNMSYNLGDPPSIITAEFSGGEITIYLPGTKRVYAVVRGLDGEPIRSKAQAGRLELDEIHVLPQIAPLVRDEKILSKEYVREHLSSSLAPLHFRNQLRLMPEYWSEFCELVAETWPGLKIVELTNRDGWPGDQLGLLIKDGDFCAEVAWMGHGVQMWLQTMWFLARIPKRSCVVIDEPDVYLHPDLQRRLARLILPTYGQIVIATHSIEIMSEVDPRSVLVIDRHQDESKFADTRPELQMLVDHIGSSQNINLARLYSTGKFLLVEGEDLNFLALFDNILFPGKGNSIAILPSLPFGGWGGWSYAVGSRMVVQNYVGGKVITYCILDSDYHTQHQLLARYDEAKNKKIELHIWTRKEIENYLLVPETICRLINLRLGSKKKVATPTQIDSQIDAIVERLKENLISELGTEFLNEDHKGGFPSANKRAKVLVVTAWKSRNTRWARVSGKTVLSELTKWSQKTFGVSFGPMAILRELRQEEIPEEVKAVIKAINYGHSLQPLRLSKFD